MAVEVEVAELLYALVRAQKPNVVVEAGAGNGYASVFIAAALQANGRGLLFTFEQDLVYAESAHAKLAGLPAKVCAGWSSSHTGLDPDLVFLDSLGGPDGRDTDLGNYPFEGEGRDVRSEGRSAW